MKDEIKEILEGIEVVIKHDGTLEFNAKELKILLDYITNLQEENERLKETIENLTTMAVCGDKKQIKNTAQYKLDIYKSRNKKAIEYCSLHTRLSAKDLLNILERSDKE